MKAQKVTLTVVMESLSIQVASGMLSDVAAAIAEGKESGFIQCDDGDEIKWTTERVAVEF